MGRKDANVEEPKKKGMERERVEKVLIWGIWG